MEKLLEQFKAIAPYILDNVMARLTGEENEDAALAIIHEEILHYFEAHQNMTMQYLAFTEDQRRAFAKIMYDIHHLKGEKATAKPNPVYESFVKETGKSGALEFICHHLSRDDLNSFDIYQRADGIQLAVNADGKAEFIRPFKSANWLNAGFEASLDYYWLVSKGEKIWGRPNRTAVFNDGILTVSEEA
ncbi:hypothetical protein ACED16_05345 [Enterobacter hormaechei]